MTKRIEGEQHKTRLNRRGFLKTAAAGLAAGPLLAACATSAPAVSGDTNTAARPKKDRYKMAFIQFMPHTVPAAWSKGIEDVLKIQQNVDYQLLDGQGKADVQINLMDTAINQGIDAIFLQPVDSVGVGPAIKKARAAGIPVRAAALPVAALRRASEVFLSSTGGGAIGVSRLDGVPIGGRSAGDFGPVTRQLQAAYWALHDDPRYAEPVRYD